MRAGPPSHGDSPGEGDEDLPGIEELLDQGYEQLDGFVQWLEAGGESTRVAQQHCFNAEALLDYLANQQVKSVADADEYDLRWFLFSYAIRKSLADQETASRAPDSLRLFFSYLQQHWETPSLPWLGAVIEERETYHRRCREFAALDETDEQRWQQGFREWCAELEEDLDSRALWLANDLGGGLTWANAMGWQEAALRMQAHRDWQRGREMLLNEGLDADAVRERLTVSLREWMDTAQERLGGATPREAIQGERESRVTISEPSDDEEESDGFQFPG